MNCNHDCNQGRSCCCKQPSRLILRGKVWLAYFATVAAAICTAVAILLIMAPGV